MVKKDILLEAYMHMCEARAMAETYDANRPICKYVHSTSRGHEAIQLAVGMQLQPYDYCSPYYRDEAMAKPKILFRVVEPTTRTQV